MDGATEVPTSQFGDLIIAKIKEHGAALRAEAEQRRRELEAERRALEAQRVADPPQAMIASGRMPTTVGGIMSPVISVKNDELVNVAMHQMIEKGMNAVMVQPDASGQWGIMTDRDVLKKVISANRSPAHPGRRNCHPAAGDGQARDVVVRCLAAHGRGQRAPRRGRNGRQASRHGDRQRPVPHRGSVRLRRSSIAAG